MKDTEIVALYDIKEDDFPTELTVATEYPLSLGESFFVVLEVRPREKFKTEYSGWHIYRSTVRSIFGRNFLESRQKSMARPIAEDNRFMGIEIDDT